MALDDYSLKRGEDIHSLSGGTVRSLGTASSLTVWGEDDLRRRASSSKDGGQGEQSRLRRMSVRGLRATLRDIELQLEEQCADDIPTNVYGNLLELHRMEFYCEEIREHAWDIILAEMSRQRVQGLVRALRSWPLADLMSFFTLLSAAEKDHWHHYPGTVVPRKPPGFDQWIMHYHANTSFFYMIIAVLSDLRDVLDKSQVLRVLNVYPILQPIALLFPAGDEKSTAPNLDSFFTYLVASYADPLNLPDRLFAFVTEYDIAKRAAAVFFDRSSPQFLSDAVDRVLGKIKQGRDECFSCTEIEAFRTSHPFNDTDTDAYSCAFGCPVWKEHPASPFLCFAVYLAYESRAAARMLLERGLTRLVEQLYDAYDDAAEFPSRWIDVSSHGHLTMLHLCHFLLLAVSRHCDLSVYVVQEELSEHLRLKSREMSERWFGVIWCE